MKRDPLDSWKWVGFLATALIVASFPLARWQEARLRRAAEVKQTPPATYVGREKCIECHKEAWEKWQGSDHDRAMDVATPETVLGDFDDAHLEMDGYTARFFRRGGKFFVNTEGPDGELADFEVRYVFGVHPLQQYLIPFPGGRYQVLGAAWDTERHQWYDMYPKQDIAPGDWLHWTRQAQNWNSMCAECHSTHLVKGYDLASDTYQTTWSEIDVSCEACHGPGSEHLAWAEVPAMGRPASENFELTVRTRDLSARQEADLCAGCHSRRYLLGPLDPTKTELLDSEVPSVLREGLYYPDGQILDEVYVYGSFVQSKMFRMGVQCSDCHDVHSLKRHKEGNDLCLQCHQAKTYNTADHHFHKEFDQGKPSPGWLCVKCHMPEKPYMVVDWRADHSIRLPRPDLSRDLGVPNPCNDQPGCHGDKTVAWSIDAMEKWYGKRKRPHYGTVLAKGRQRVPEGREELVEVTHDRSYAGIVRATAIDLLAGYPGSQTAEALNGALADEDALVRLTAIRSLNNMRVPGRAEMVAPLLYDPVEAVRIEAAVNLSDTGRERLKPPERVVYERDLHRYREVMAYSGDFAFGRFNLGNLERKLGNRSAAEAHYKAAIAIDDLFYPAKVNLAFLYNVTGRNAEAAALFREVLSAYPQNDEVAYNLGLLLAEMKQFDEAAVYLQRAAEGFSTVGRIYYNLGLVLQKLGRSEKAEQALQRAVDLEPANQDLVVALFDHHLKLGEFAAARRVAEAVQRQTSLGKFGQELLQTVKRAESRE